MARYRVVLLSEVASSGRMDAAFHCYTRDEKIASVRAGVARDIRALRVRITAQRGSPSLSKRSIRRAQRRRDTSPSGCSGTRSATTQHRRKRCGLPGRSPGQNGEKTLMDRCDHDYQHGQCTRCYQLEPPLPTRPTRGQVDYLGADRAACQKRFSGFKAQLTRAERSGDPAKIVAACNAFDDYYNRLETEPYPDDWSRWQRARDDVAFATRYA